jgi:NTE family protein
LKKSKALLLALLLIIPQAHSRDRPKIGLVLGGGGAKGLALIPTLKLLDKLDIPIDCIAGTSAGGVIGALYAFGYSGADLEKLTDEVNWENLFSDKPPRSMLPFYAKKLDGRYQLDFVLRKGIPSKPKSLLDGQKFILLFSELTFPLSGDTDFDTLPIPLRCVAVDLITAQRIALKSGSLIKAMRATMAIPTLFSPVSWEDMLLVDGGVLDNLPVDVAKEMGADIVIAVDLASPLYSKEELRFADKILTQTLRVVETDQRREKLGKIDILIVPELKGLGSMDYFFPEKLSRIKEKGRLAAEKSLPLLEALKEKYSLSRLKGAGAKSSPPGHPTISPRQEGITLDTLTILGNQRLPSSFIARLFSLKKGDQVDGPALSRKIMEMYSLGYFENIQYDVFPAAEKRIDLRLRVQELPGGKLRLGLRYDNNHKLVASVGWNVLNFIVPGGLWENEIELAGLTAFRTKISYPSLTLDFPVYPFFEMLYRDISTHFYDGAGELALNFKDRSWGFAAGFGFLLKKRINVEMSFQHEDMDVESVGAPALPDLSPGLKDHLDEIVIAAALDTLDNVWTPFKGAYFRANYEGSYEALGSDVHYERVEAALDFYKTFRQKHTLRFYGYWGTTSGRLPFYKLLNQGRPENFVGMKYDQLLGDQMKIIRADYRYKFNNFIYFKAMGNVALDFEQRWPALIYNPGLLWGTGAGIQISTPAGPLELVYSVGSKSFLEPKSARGLVYLTLGAKF